MEAVRSYLDTVLVGKPDKRSVIGARSGGPGETTEELRIIVPTYGA